MNNRLAINALLVLSLLPAGAAVINPLAQSRTLEGQIRLADPSVPGGGWQTEAHQEIRKDAAAWADLAQLSAQTPLGTSGSGSTGLDSPALGAGLAVMLASGFADGSYTATAVGAYAEVSTLSSFVLAFQVDEPVHYRLSGTVNSEQDDGRIYADAWSFVALRRVNLPGDGTTVVLETLVEQSANNTAFNYDVTGTLLPGFTYDVVGLGSVELRNDPVSLLAGLGAAAWSFSLEVTPVPEPAAGVAAAALLAGFAGWRRIAARG